MGTIGEQNIHGGCLYDLSSSTTTTTTKRTTTNNINNNNNNNTATAAAVVTHYHDVNHNCNNNTNNNNAMMMMMIKTHPLLANCTSHVNFHTMQQLNFQNMFIMQRVCEHIKMTTNNTTQHLKK